MNWGADGDDGGMNRAGDGGCGVAGGPLGGGVREESRISRALRRVPVKICTVCELQRNAGSQPARIA